MKNTVAKQRITGKNSKLNVFESKYQTKRKSTHANMKSIEDGSDKNNSCHTQCQFSKHRKKMQKKKE